jgi:sRNA-binding regulator protein Hfq
MQTQGDRGRDASFSRDPRGQQRHHPGDRPRRLPFDLTFAESFYYLKQMKNRTLMTVQLLDGETLYGIIEWYDRDAIKLVRDRQPNLVVPKRNIKYLYKSEDGTGAEVQAEVQEEAERTEEAPEPPKKQRRTRRAKQPQEAQ